MTLKVMNIEGWASAENFETGPVGRIEGLWSGFSEGFASLYAEFPLLRISVSRGLGAP